MSAPVEIGDFRIERPLGAGGMGIVYLARQMSLDRLVALKILGNSLTDPRDKARFQREAQAAAKLRHPHIASVYFIGQDEQFCYLAMEYVEGVTLREVIKRLARTNEANPIANIEDYAHVADDDAPRTIERFDEPATTLAFDSPNAVDAENPITPQARLVITKEAYIRRCCEIARDVAMALSHAHEQGVIHRDVKPDNLMLAPKGDVYIIDFGVARFLEDTTLTHTGQLVGTPLYMSPEQITGRLALDPRTDVYSLGMVLYELLSLSPPVRAPTREGVLRSIIMKALPPISWKNQSVPSELESVIHNALAKDPDDRYPSAIAFAQDLDNFLKGHPVLAQAYRYRFDDREILASRPNAVVIVAFAMWLAGILSGVTGAVAMVVSAVYGRTPRIADSMSVWFFVAPLTIFFVLSVFMGSGLLAGKRWAQIGATVVCALFAVLLLLVYSFQEVVRGPVYFLTSLPALAASLLVIVALHRGKIAKWFADAGRARKEQLQAR